MDKFESLGHTAWDCKYHVAYARLRKAGKFHSSATA